MLGQCTIVRVLRTVRTAVCPDVCPTGNRPSLERANFSQMKNFGSREQFEDSMNSLSAQLRLFILATVYDALMRPLQWLESIRTLETIVFNFGCRIAFSRKPSQKCSCLDFVGFNSLGYVSWLVS